MSCNSTEKGNLSQTPIVIEKETGPVQAAVRSAPFSRGVNFSEWFESFSAQTIPFTKYKEEDFADLKSLGADVIRLPIRMHSMTRGAPDYTFDSLFLKFLDFAVDLAEKYELYIIIDNHSFDPVAATSNDIDKILIPVWAQIAQRYKDRSGYVVYEVLNEPHGISDERWGEIQGIVIDEIRKYDKKHAIIVGGTEYNSIAKLSKIPKYTDENLIYTFHFYEPYLFTHQGASWGSPPVLTNLAGVPFPADRKRMPKIPADLRGTWIESSLNNNYAGDASPSKLYRILDTAVSFSIERDVPVFCGEFGVFIPNSIQEDRVRWYDFVTDALDRRNISRASWDYFGGFGIFNPGGINFNSDLNIDVVKALAFTPPAQIPCVAKILKTELIIYDDYPNRELSAGNWGDKTDFSLYETTDVKGDFAIRWADALQYNAFCFIFRQDADFSELVEAGYSLEFFARTTKPVNFDVRFLNPESASSIPWRIRYTIDEKTLPADGNWHIIRIPLADMKEHGAWINAKQEWVSPQGKFSWKNISRLEFVAEHGDMKGQCVRFDEIRVTK